MRPKPGYSSSILPKITLGVLFLAALSFILVTPYAVQAQDNPTATPSPNPTIIALENQITTQQVQLEEQARTINKEIEDRERAVADWHWKWGIAGSIVGALVTILATLGISNLPGFKKQLKEMEEKWQKHTSELEDKWEKESGQKLNYLLEKFDLKNLSIFIPKGEGELRRRLELSGFDPDKLQRNEYENLEELSSLYGVIVIALKEKVRNETTEDGKTIRNPSEEQKNIRNYIKQHRPDPKKTAFVIYAPPGTWVESETFETFDNLVTGNFPSTVVSNILAIGRGLEF